MDTISGAAEKSTSQITTVVATNEENARIDPFLGLYPHSIPGKTLVLYPRVRVKGYCVPTPGHTPLKLEGYIRVHSIGVSYSLGSCRFKSFSLG